MLLSTHIAAAAYVIVAVAVVIHLVTQCCLLSL